MEFHIHSSIRSSLGISSSLFRSTGNLIIPDFSAARNLADKLRRLGSIAGQDTRTLSAGRLNAMGLVDEVLHIVVRMYRERVEPDVIAKLGSAVVAELGEAEYRSLLHEFCTQFPPKDVYGGLQDVDEYLSGSTASDGGASVPNTELALEELVLLKLANENPAFQPFRFLFEDGIREDVPLPGSLDAKTRYRRAFEAIERRSMELPAFGPAGEESGFLELLRMPARNAPDSLEAQLLWIREHWGAGFDEIGIKVLRSLDMLKEEEAPRFPPGPGPQVAYTYNYASVRHEYEKFTQDRDWMPSLVLIAKNALVWMHQLSEKYGRRICRLDEIPDPELDIIASSGINGLWLIGIWERSAASEKIKRQCGNPEAAASAYSLFDYEIATEIGGWAALDSLRERCLWRGIRLAADMVPNHTGIDSAWVRQRPELFIGQDHCPFPGYTFNGPDLSEDPSIGIWIEDHYYSRSDAAVVFKRLDRRSGKVRYIYHGNDGTGMAWNDTAQIDFLNPEARAAVMERILHVARHFSIIRFDAAMVLAKQHVRRLWYPAPGSGGAVPSRAEHSMRDEEFDRAMPHEFWREVVDACAQKAPDTLLLAEAFWMMEGYFTRTLGMHRVYNSAFMNMLKDEKNSLYRLTIKNTQEFDKQILKRFVNFMSNPDEETAVAQFGNGDKYFGVCTLMATMPGLPMFGHGQVEGFTEKYGMEYRRSYKTETPDAALVARHEREIFPLLRMRRQFAEVEHFNLFDFVVAHGRVDENVFAYSNGSGDDRYLVFYNNFWQRSQGTIYGSSPSTEKDEKGNRHTRRRSLAEALGLESGPGNFLAARELRTGLWYLHRCSDLDASGWSLSLEGYQTRVFGEFTRIHDMDGSWTQLWASLRGEGIPDLDDGLEEAGRPDLYAFLGKTIDSVHACAALVSAEGTEDADGKLESAIAETAQNAETYFSWLSQAIVAEGGVRPGIAAVPKGRAMVVSGIEMIRLLARKPETHDARELFAAVAGTERGARALLDFVFISSLSSMNAQANRSEELHYLLEKFLVKKKLLQAARRSPAPATGPVAAIAEDALCELVFAFAARPRDTASQYRLHEGDEAAALQRSAASRALELLRWMKSDPVARSALDVNEWEGVEYFNKERFETLLVLWPCFAVLEKALESLREYPASGREEKMAFLAKAFDLQAFEVVAIFSDALETCEYRLDTLISSIEHA